MANNYGIVDDYSRVSIFLPVNDREEIDAASAVIKVIGNLYNGSTHSLVRPHTFIGHWWDEDDADWKTDKICWLIADAPHHIGDTDLDTDLELIKLEALDIYNQLGKPQKVVWIFVHQSWRPR